VLLSGVCIALQSAATTAAERFLLSMGLVNLRALTNCVLLRQLSRPVVPHATRGVPRLHTHIWRLVLASLAAPQLTGCESAEDCQVHEARCEGHVALNCETAVDVKGKSRVFRETDCGTGTCQIDDQGAFCAVDPTPSPACNGASESVCNGSTVTNCRSGYASSTYDCTTKARAGVAFGSPTIPASAGTFCVTSTQLSSTIGLKSQRAFCAIDAEPALACQGAPDDSSAPVFECDGDDRVACFDGYILERTNCGSGRCSMNARVGQCI